VNTGKGKDIVVDLDEDEPAKLAPAIVDEEGEATAVVDEDADLVGGIPARAVLNADGSITLPLTKPVTVVIRSQARGDRTEVFSALTLHPLIGADIRAVHATSKESQIVVMLARSARIREAVMNVLYDKMMGRDVVDAGTIVDSFFGGGRTTGRSS